MTELGELTYRRVHRARRELVFECMTTPEHLAQFWGPSGTTTPVDGITVDLRPGGVFETVMVNEVDGSQYTMGAVYQDVAPPERLVWRETASGVVTTITFNDLGDGTTEVTYTLVVDLGIPMLGMFKRKAEKVIIDTALKELKKRVESGTAG